MRFWVELVWRSSCLCGGVLFSFSFADSGLSSQEADHYGVFFADHGIVVVAGFRRDLKHSGFRSRGFDVTTYLLTSPVRISTKSCIETVASINSDLKNHIELVVLMLCIFMQSHVYIMIARICNVIATCPCGRKCVLLLVSIGARAGFDVLEGNGRAVCVFFLLFCYSSHGGILAFAV